MEEDAMEAVERQDDGPDSGPPASHLVPECGATTRKRSPQTQPEAPSPPRKRASLSPPPPPILGGRHPDTRGTENGEEAGEKEGRTPKDQRVDGERNGVRVTRHGRDDDPGPQNVMSALPAEMLYAVMDACSGPGMPRDALSLAATCRAVRAIASRWYGWRAFNPRSDPRHAETGYAGIWCSAQLDPLGALLCVRAFVSPQRSKVSSSARTVLYAVDPSAPVGSAERYAALLPGCVRERVVVVSSQLQLHNAARSGEAWAFLDLPDEATDDRDCGNGKCDGNEGSDAEEGEKDEEEKRVDERSSCTIVRLPASEWKDRNLRKDPTKSKVVLWTRAVPSTPKNATEWESVGPARPSERPRARTPRTIGGSAAKDPPFATAPRITLVMYDRTFACGRRFVAWRAPGRTVPPNETEVSVHWIPRCVSPDLRDKLLARWRAICALQAAGMQRRTHCDIYSYEYHAFFHGGRLHTVERLGASGVSVPASASVVWTRGPPVCARPFVDAAGLLARLRAVTADVRERLQSAMLEARRDLAPAAVLRKYAPGETERERRQAAGHERALAELEVEVLRLRRGIEALSP